MTTRHTPGPWEIGYGDGISGPRVAPLVYLDGVEGIADAPIRAGRAGVAWVLSSAPDERMQADARLIASAPDLLEFVAGFLADYQSEDGLYDMKHYAKKAHELVAKATGEF